MMKITMNTTLVLALVLGVSACEKNVECERERLALAKTFSQVQLTAADAKKVDPERKEKIGEAAAKEHVDHWAKLENKASLLHSAVMTEQVTWDSAEKALQEAKAAYEQDNAETMFEQGFGEALKQAEAAFASFKSKCR